MRFGKSLIIFFQSLKWINVFVSERICSPQRYLKVKSQSIEAARAGAGAGDQICGTDIHQKQTGAVCAHYINAALNCSEKKGVGKNKHPPIYIFIYVYFITNKINYIYGKDKYI